MIQFSLRCDRDHRFESWFQSSEAFDKLHASGMLSCAVCGSNHVEKAMMAPRISEGRSTPEPAAAPAGPDAAAPAQGPLAAPATAAQQALAALRAHVEANSEYVGLNFAAEARKMHLGDRPERAIHGEAKPEEARQLVEDGVPVTPLPFVPGRKTN